MFFRHSMVLIALLAPHFALGGICENAFREEMDSLKNRIVADIRSPDSLDAMVEITQMVARSDLSPADINYGLEILFSILELPVTGPIVGVNETHREYLAETLGRSLLHRDLSREAFESFVNRSLVIYFKERETSVKLGLMDSLFDIVSKRQDPLGDYAMQALTMIEYRETDHDLKSHAQYLLRGIPGVRQAQQFVLSVAAGNTIDSSQVVEAVTKSILIPLIDRHSTGTAQEGAIDALDAFINELHESGVSKDGTPLRAFMIALMIGPSVAVRGQAHSQNLCLFVTDIIQSGRLSDVSSAAWQSAAESLLDEPNVPDLNGNLRPVSIVVSNPSLQQVVKTASWTIPYAAALQTLGDGLIWTVQSGPNRLTTKGVVNADVGVMEVTIYEHPQLTVGFPIPVSMHVDAFVPSHKQAEATEVTRDMGVRIRKHLGLDEEYRFAIVYDKKPIANGDHEGRFLLRLLPTVSVKIPRAGTFAPTDIGPQKSKAFHVMVYSMLKHFLEAARDRPIQ